MRWIVLAASLYILLGYGPQPPRLARTPAEGIQLFRQSLPLTLGFLLLALALLVVGLLPVVEGMP